MRRSDPDYGGITVKYGTKWCIKRVSSWLSIGRARATPSSCFWASSRLNWCRLCTMIGWPTSTSKTCLMKWSVQFRIAELDGLSATCSLIHRIYKFPIPHNYKDFFLFFDKKCETVLKSAHCGPPPLLALVATVALSILTPRRRGSRRQLAALFCSYWPSYGSSTRFRHSWTGRRPADECDCYNTYMCNFIKCPNIQVIVQVS